MINLYFQTLIKKAKASSAERFYRGPDGLVLDLLNPNHIDALNSI